MKYTTIPQTEIKISKICLGTMTWGNQNTQDEGFAQLDMAVEQGINFIDTAELYPVPATAETQGRTSTIIGNWLNERKNRDQLVLATKIAGPGDYTSHISTLGYSPEGIKTAVHKSLKRLQTDYIDLYQLHWPERHTNRFGIRDYQHRPDDPWTDNFHEVLLTLDEMIKAGKIRHIGISNESSWGTMRFLEESKIHRLPRMRTIQNSYSLLNRTFEGDLAEISVREKIGLLAYSPLAFGVLSGKYVNNTASENSRLKLFPRFSRYSSDQSTEATKKYLAIAEKFDISLPHMALAFVNSRPFVTANIIGATNLEQLKENISSIDVSLTNEILQAIGEVHAVIPNPAP